MFPNQNTQSENNIYANTEIIGFDKTFNMDNDLKNSLNNNYMNIKPSASKNINYNESNYNYEAFSSIYSQETKERNRIKPIPLNLIGIENKNTQSENILSYDDNSQNIIEIASSIKTKMRTQLLIHMTR